ncbi:TPA: hypothetical protein KOS98_003795 [Clostridioides difficile]|uniref:hypothetical protein n=1 Tax=Clostridioides difficile TaxID=1496 RepID=UPI00097FE903|nr:hypothetical protein [Clostridioides difficile]SJT87684.1 Uncharacterised protein [Clostridioides difficile]HBF6471972.1 hypothetical protein [Clostridioides difficile]
MGNFILEMLFDNYIECGGKTKIKNNESYLEALKEAENSLKEISKNKTEEQKILIRDYEEKVNFVKLLEEEHAYYKGFIDGVKLSKEVKELSGVMSFK